MLGDCIFRPFRTFPQAKFCWCSVDFTCNVYKEFSLLEKYMCKECECNVANNKMLGMRPAVFFRAPGGSLASNSAPILVGEWM